MKYNLFIDGQNVPARYIDEIIKYCNALNCKQEHARLYASNEQIAKIFKSHGTLLEDNDIDPIPVRCKARKNSVDIRIAVDVIEQAWEDQDGDVIILATDDSDFTHVASKVISYGTEFHLLYAGVTGPSGYSPRAIKHRLIDERATRTKIADRVKGVAELLPSRQAVKHAITALMPQPEAAQLYQWHTPLKELNRENFAKRLLECSPVAIDSRSLFNAFKDQTGTRWKSERSKKSAQAFFDETFGAGLYLYVPWPGLSLNIGYFVNLNIGHLTIEEGARDPVLSLVGASRELVQKQSEILADRLRSSDHKDFNALYDASAETNLMPRYGAWTIFSCWKRLSGPQPKKAEPIEIDRSVTAAALCDSYFDEVRDRFESGRLRIEAAELERALG